MFPLVLTDRKTIRLQVIQVLQAQGFPPAY